MKKSQIRYGLILVIILCILDKSLGLYQTQNGKDKKCDLSKCFQNGKYECKLISPLSGECPCLCDITDDNRSINLAITWISVVSWLFSVVLIVIFFESEDLRRAPGDIIMAIGIADMILSSRLIIYSGLSLIFSDQNPSGLQCRVNSMIYIFAEYLQIFYNLFFFLYLIMQMRSTLKASKFPHFLYHLLPILMAVLIAFYYDKTKSLGMAMDGNCTEKTELDINNSVLLMVIGIGVPGYTYYHLKTKIPKNEKINQATKEFLEYYSLYALMVSIIYIGLSISGFLIYAGLLGYLRDTSNKILIKVGFWVQSIFISSNPIVLTAIRINDPSIKQHWDIIFPCFIEKTAEPVDIDEEKSLEYEKIDARLSMSEEKMPLKRKESMTGEAFESMMENTSILLKIKHNLKVQVIYSIITSIHHFWNSETNISDFGNFYKLNLKEASEHKKKVEITEEILQENLPFLLDEIKQKKYGAVNGKLTVYAPKIFNLISSLDEVGQNYLGSLDLNENFNRIVKAGTNTKGGQSGEFFFFSADNKLIIKSMKDSELKLLLKILPDYVEHFRKNPNSLISKIFSVVTFEMGESFGKEKYNLLIMRNINGFPSKNVIRAYDLKGSTHGRQTIKEEGPFEKADIGRFGTLKDLDFKEYEKKLDIDEDYANDFKIMLAKDAEFLKEHNLIDYSFLVLIIDHMLPIPTRKTYYKRKKNDQRNSENNSRSDVNRYSDIVDQRTDNKRDSFISQEKKKSRIEDLSVMKMTGGSYFYHVGIIDYLIEYGWKKKLEVFFKKFFACNPRLDISVQRPEYYADRFVKFISSIVVQDE